MSRSNQNCETCVPAPFAARLFALLLLLLTLSGCGQPPARSGPQVDDLTQSESDRVINMAFTTSWGDMNPYYTTSSTMYELALYDKLYDKLVFTDKAGAVILPRAALRWESADDGRSIVFYLDQNASWSDGQPVTAADWVFTVNLLSEPDIAFTTRVFTPLLTGTDENGSKTGPEAAGAEALDDTTLKLRFKERTNPRDFLLRYNRQFLVLPKHLLSDIAPSEILEAPYWKNPVGSGPCVFVSQVTGAELVLSPNRFYHLGTGNWDTLILRVADASGKLTAITSGEIDMYELGNDISVEEKPLAESLGLRVRDAEVQNFFMEVLLNTDSIPDSRIRQALHLAVDKEAIITAAARDVGTAAYSYEMFTSDYHDPGLDFPRDVEKAKALLAEAGYDSSIPYQFAFAAKRENLAALLTQQWAVAGIRVEMVIVDVSTMFAGLANGTYDIGLSGHTGTVHPLWFEEEFPANDNPAPDPLREHYVSQIENTLDTAERIGLVQSYQRYLAEQVYFIPLYFSGSLWVESPRVSGIRNSASLMCNDNVWEWFVN